MKTTNRFSKVLNLIIGISAVLVAMADQNASGVPGTLTVTSTADSGLGTLRDALASAADGETIDFALTLPATIALTTGELLVDKSVMILGPSSANLALDGNGISRVFHIAPGATVVICSLTITNGHVTGDYPAGDGGGIYNDHATLTVSNCIVSGNSTPSVGGGIFNDAADGSATVRIVSSTVSRNSAAAAGGIYNYGIRGSATMEISASTISGNSASYYVGGIYNLGAGDAQGGSGSASLLIVNSSVSGNLAGTDVGGIMNHGGYSGHGTLVMHACTLSGNSAGGVAGGIWNYGAFSGSATLEIGNSILNASQSGSIYNTSGTVTSLGYNLSSDDGGGFLTAMGDQINTDPLVGPLQDNGGPTFTHALLPGSPAIDAGDPNFVPPPDFDQRGPGFPRVANGRIDIGAFERKSPCAPFGFSGFLSPVGGADATGGSFASPLRTFKLASTIPLKFTISCNGSSVLSGVHTLQAIKYSDATTSGAPIDATPQDAATLGNQFRLTADRQWQFNLDTKATGMSLGIWQLIATLSDGSQHSVWIQIK